MQLSASWNAVTDAAAPADGSTNAATPTTAEALASPPVADHPAPTKERKQQQLGRDDDPKAYYGAALLAALAAALVGGHDLPTAAIRVVWPAFDLMIELSVTSSVAGTLNLVLAALCYDRGPRPSPMRAVALGLMMPAMMALPFVVRDYCAYGFSSCSMALCLWIGVWKALDVLGGTAPADVHSSRLAFAIHFAVPCEYRHGDALPARAEKGALLGRLADVALSGASYLTLLQFRSLFAALPPTPLVQAAQLYSHVWLIYLFLSLWTGACAVLIALAGLDALTVWRSPLLLSRSPSDFWACRWNLLVHGLFHRSIFRPLRKRGCPAALCALLAFVVSGLFHEYAFAPAARGAAVGCNLLFFTLQA